ncbi:MAG: DUF1565 domain-containing protein [Planctomycetota bacterium]|nr:DUF1565 domain-containing protein [Planctomycetota bacterium]
MRTRIGFHTLAFGFALGVAFLSGCGGSGGRRNATLPGPPTGLMANPSHMQIDLAWNAVAGATSYSVYRDTTTPVVSGPATLVTSGVTATSYSDTGLTNGTTYFYVVTAVNAGGESPDSMEVWATPGTYWVDGVSGSDSNSGSFVAPFRTITFALGVAVSGQFIKVLPATYDAALGEIFPLQPALGVQLIGDEANLGAGANPVVISGIGLVGGTGDDATVVGADGGRIAGFMIGDSTSAVFHFGVYISGVTTTAASNTFMGPTYGGVLLEGAGSSIVENNEFDTVSYGVYVRSCPDAPSVRNNLFRAMAIPIDVVGTTTNVIIEANTITGNGQSGIQVQHGTPRIENNVFDLASGYTYGGVRTAFPSAMPILRGNVFQCTTGVVIDAGTPDLGTSSDPGNNDFSLVSGVSITHNAPTTVSAIGNTFPNNPPILGVDIVITAGGTLLY